MDSKTIMDEALKVLREGGVILYPTDTIWGIGCDATNPTAVDKVYSIKRRSDSKALVLLACDLDMVARYVRAIPDIAIDLVEVNDRPMTIIYPEGLAGSGPTPEKYRLAYNTVASDGSVGIRIPMMDFCRNLIRALGRPIVSTSANISGEPSPGTYKDIPEDIRKAVDYIVDPRLESGSTGLASQIIKVGMDSRVQIIRP